MTAPGIELLPEHRAVAHSGRVAFLTPSEWRVLNDRGPVRGKASGAFYVHRCHLRRKLAAIGVHTALVTTLELRPADAR
jgi:hypothetical protein